MVRLQLAMTTSVGLTLHLCTLLFTSFATKKTEQISFKFYQTLLVYFTVQTIDSMICELSFTRHILQSYKKLQQYRNTTTTAIHIGIVTQYAHYSNNRTDTVQN